MSACLLRFRFGSSKSPRTTARHQYGLDKAVFKSGSLQQIEVALVTASNLTCCKRFACIHTTQLQGHITETSVTSIMQQLRALEELVTHHRMTTEELHRLELELRTIIERIDAIRTIARDLNHIPKLTAEDTKGLDKLEET